MRIKVRTPDAKFTLLLPNLLLFNRLTGSLLTKAATAHLGIDVDARQAGRLLAELRKIKKKYGRFTLVDVETADGEIVKITL